MYSCRQLYFSGFWLPGPPPLINDEAQLNLIENKKLADNVHQLKFTVNGSYLYSLQIRPKPGVKLENWNLLEEVPEPNDFNGQKAYFAMVTHGLDAPPLNITLDFKVCLANSAS